jgi:shikimate dehydrogenase
MEKQEFGLLGKNISYSFSKKYFEEKFKKLFLKNHSYNFFDISEIENVTRFLENLILSG